MHIITMHYNTASIKITENMAVVTRV